MKRIFRLVAFAIAGLLFFQIVDARGGALFDDCGLLTGNCHVQASAPKNAAAQGTPAAENSWSMAGANLERTSWSPEAVPGHLEPVWYKTFQPYIPQRVQIVAANGTLYVATAAGLYALDAATGAEKWVYPTEMPLGHSPTVADGVVYVGGFDNLLHAIDAATGDQRWTFKAGAGFQTNPLVVEGKVYAGNRDGSFYAIHATGPNAGQLAWKYTTGGPVLYSAAYKDGVIFFASNDNHAYALNAGTGELVWKSQKLPGAGFYSWWPVVYKDRVIFSGSNAYRSMSAFGGGLAHTELAELYPNNDNQPTGTLIGSLGTAAGDWAPDTPTVDASAIINYFTEKPWRRTVFVLDRFTGEDREIAPVLWAGNDGAGSRYPPVLGADGVLYQQNNYLSSPVIAGGHISGWQPGVPHITVISSDWGAVDEFHAASAGGNLVYWNLCCDRQAGALDITKPNTLFAQRYNEGIRPPTGTSDKNREWTYFSYNLHEVIPGYNQLFFNPHPTFTKPYAAFGGPNGVYGFHSDTNPPVPYNGRLYMHRSNTIIAFGPPTSGAPTQLPMAEASAPATTMTPPSALALQLKLKEEVDKILAAGHLRPGYMSHGLLDLRAQAQCGDELIDYFHQPAETILTLIMALPHLPQSTQDQVKQYLTTEFTNYPPYANNHVGWTDGAARESFDLPPEVQATLADHPPAASNQLFQTSGGWQEEGVWGLNPYSFYALWKYAEQFGGADSIFAASKDHLEPVPSDTLLLKMPSVHNAYIAGYLGYLNLEKLAGQPESSQIRAELTRLMALRAQNFTKDSAYKDIYSITEGTYCRTLNIASNFMYMVPELADYLGQHAPNAVQSAIQEYEVIAPYWFVSFAPEGLAENGHTLLYDAHALFMAKALIFDEPLAELGKYLDVPGFATGDLYYIQKLVVALENEGSQGINVQQTFLPFIH